MKRVVSLVVLIVALSGIVAITVYTLTTKAVKINNEEKVVQPIENVTKDINNNGVSEIYNVYLNGERHKIKLEYRTTIVEGTNIAKVVLNVYMNGGIIINDVVVSNVEAQTIEDLFKDTRIVENVRIPMSDLEIIKEGGKDYFFIKTGAYLDGHVKSKYYLFDDECHALVKGIVAKDDSAYYTNQDDEKLDCFYDHEGMVRAKREGNTFYSLELEEDKNNKKIINLVEYKYEFKDGEMEKEVLNTYENIKINERVIEENNEDTTGEE